MPEGSDDWRFDATIDSWIYRATPCDLAAERRVLGSMMRRDWATRFLRAEHFQRSIHQKVYTAIRDLQRKKVIPDSTAVIRWLDRACGKQDEHITFVLMMIEEARPHRFDKDVNTIVACWQRRRLIEAAEWIIKNAYNPKRDPEDIWKHARRLRL